MKLFNLDNTYIVVCETKSTRNGFKHIATLCKRGCDIATVKVNYLNHTWENFTYETILEKIIYKNFADNEKEKYLTIIKEGGI